MLPVRFADQLDMNYLIAMLLTSHLLTPGVIRPLTKDQICSIKWGLDHRHVTLKMRRIIRTRYHIKSLKGYELDHLIPRELGGADDVNNLWPQPWPDAHIKDLEENRLHKAVCDGTIELNKAQELMRNWNGKT